MIFPAPHPLTDVLRSRRYCACDFTGIVVDRSPLNVLALLFFAARHMTQEARDLVRIQGVDESPARAGEPKRATRRIIRR